MDETASLDSYLFDRDARRAEAPAPNREPPARPDEERRVRALDGAPLAASIYRAPPGQRPRPPVVLAPATGVKRRFYGRFARFLAGRGFDVVTFDYRGIGGSRQAARAPRMREWGELDLAGVVRDASLTLGRRDGRVALVGHSVGGQLVGLMPDNERVEALVTVGAQSGDYRLWPLPSRLAMALLWHAVVPGVTHAVGYLPGALGVGEDLPRGVALEWARWCRTPGYLAAEGGATRAASFARVRAPILAFGFDDDPYAPRAAVDALLSLYRSATVERRQVPRPPRGKIGHFGFFRRRFETTLWAEAADFLARHPR